MQSNSWLHSETVIIRRMVYTPFAKLTSDERRGSAYHSSFAQGASWFPIGSVDPLLPFWLWPTGYRIATSSSGPVTILPAHMGGDFRRSTVFSSTTSLAIKFLYSKYICKPQAGLEGCQRKCLNRWFEGSSDDWQYEISKCFTFLAILTSRHRSCGWHAYFWLASSPREAVAIRNCAIEVIKELNLKFEIYDSLFRQVFRIRS